ncbi:hypothetical protein MRX96_030920 [Rhipicephalus microplus]
MTGNVRLRAPAASCAGPALLSLLRASGRLPLSGLRRLLPSRRKLRRRVLFRCTGGRTPRRLLAARPVARLPCCVRAVLARHFSCRVLSAVVVIDYSRPTDTRLFSAHRGVCAARRATRFEPRRATGRTVCTLRLDTLFREEARIVPAPLLSYHHTFVLAVWACTIID